MRAAQIGVQLHRCRWSVYHYTNYTSRQTPGAYDRSAGNERLFVERVMEWREGKLKSTIISALGKWTERLGLRWWMVDVHWHKGKDAK